MQQWKTLVACIALTVVGAREAAGQTCVGLPNASVARSSLTGRASSRTNGKSVGVRLALAGARGFGGLSTDIISNRGLTDKAAGVGGDAGFIIPLGASRKMELCPVAQARFVHGPNTSLVVGALKRTTVSGGIGLGLGGVVDVSPTLSVIPFARAELLTVRARLSTQGARLTNNETGGLLGGGFALRFNEIFTVTPGVSIPVGFDREDNDLTFTLGATIGFRRGR